MLISNKIVDVVALNVALNNRFKDTNLSRSENKQDFSNFVDIEFVQNVEKDAHVLANDPSLKRDEDVINNIDAFRDCIRDFVDEIYEKYVDSLPNLIKSQEFNEDLCGFIIQLVDDRLVQVKFDFCNDVLNGNYHTFKACIDYENDYDLSLNEAETEFFEEYIKTNKEILAKSYELDKEFEKKTNDEFEYELRKEEYNY